MLQISVTTRRRGASAENVPAFSRPAIVRRLPIWWVALMLIAAPAFALDGGVVLDRTVASVAGKAISQSELDLEARIFFVLAGGTEAAFAELSFDDLSKALQQTIDYRVATIEADAFYAFQIEQSELDTEVARFRTALGGQDVLERFMKTYDVDLNDIAQVLRRSMRAQRALDGKLRLKAQASEAEARTYMRAHPELSNESVERVRHMLFVRKFKELVAKELKQARKTVDVRLLGPFAPVPKEARP